MSGIHQNEHTSQSSQGELAPMNRIFSSKLPKTNKRGACVEPDNAPSHPSPFPPSVSFLLPGPLEACCFPHLWEHMEATVPLQAITRLPQLRQTFFFTEMSAAWKSISCTMAISHCRENLWILPTIQKFSYVWKKFCLLLCFKSTFSPIHCLFWGKKILEKKTFACQKKKRTAAVLSHSSQTLK